MALTGVESLDGPERVHYNLQHMENTGKVLFDDDTTPQWFIALGERWIGPLTAADVYDKVLSQEITWAHYVWRAGQAEWKRICDTPTFQAAVPTQPPAQLKSELMKASVTPPPTPQSGGSVARAPAPPAPPETAAPARQWFLYYNDSQFGPFSEEEVRRFLKIGKIHGRVHAWKDGMPGWLRLEKVSGFEEDVAEAARVRESKMQAASPRISATAAQAAQAGHAPSGKSAAAAKPEVSAPSGARLKASSPAPSGVRAEQRKSPRRPLLARVIFAQGEEVAVGVCRDVSVGGMQVLTDRIPGVPGSQIKLNVSAPGEKGPKPFVAGGVIVRVLEDGRGFSFRFDRLPDESRKIIEDYIRSEE